METLMLLRDAIDIPKVLAASDFVIKLDAGVEQAQRTIDEYVVTDSLALSYGKALDYLAHALETSSDQGAFVHGSFGSGKSHFMAVLHLLINANPAARALPGLQGVIATHEAALAANVLTLDYHLIGATSFESALYSGYLRQVRHLHPEAPLPLLHKSDALFANAASLREQIGDDAFFGGLPAASGWGGFAGGWNAQSYDAAVAGAIDATDRLSLASDLVATYFGGYVHTGSGSASRRAFGSRRARQGAGLPGRRTVPRRAGAVAGHAPGRLDVRPDGRVQVAKLVEAGIGGARCRSSRSWPGSATSRTSSATPSPAPSAWPSARPSPGGRTASTRSSSTPPTWPRSPTSGCSNPHRPRAPPPWPRPWPT
jgi:hypothetical protein